MSDAVARRPSFPRVALIGGWTIVLGALAFAAYGSLTGMAANADATQVVAARNLVFADRPDGAVKITDGKSGAVVDVEHGQLGFLRGTLRGFARARHEAGLGPAQPMTLTAYADGRLILYDAETRRHVDLEAFGADNEAVFSRFLNLEPVRMEQ